MDRQKSNYALCDSVVEKLTSTHPEVVSLKLVEKMDAYKTLCEKIEARVDASLHWTITTYDVYNP